MIKTESKVEKNNPGITFIHSLLFKAGLIVFAALVISILIGAQHTYYLVINEEEETVLQALDSASVALSPGLIKDEDFLEALFEYWEDNYDRMEFLTREEQMSPEKMQAWGDVHQKVWNEFLNDPEFGLEDFRKMSEEDQRILAEVLYGHLEGLFELVIANRAEKKNFWYFFFKYIGDDQAFVYFTNTNSDDKGSGLGDIFPFSLDKHPVVSKILETGEGQDRTEHIVSTIDGKEYLYGAVPVIVKGKPVGVIALQYPWSETRDNLLSRSVQIGSRVLLYMLIADIILLILLNRFVLYPVKKVQNEIQAYTSEKDSSVIEKNLTKTNSRKDEVGSLSRDVTALAKEVDGYISKVCALAEEKAKVGAELSFAADIQESALLKEFPAFPDRKEFDLYAFMKPSLEVGGDFYDYFLIDDDHLALVIADVSDKGVPSALFMMMTKTMIKTLFRSVGGNMHPKELFSSINERLSEMSANGMFVTVWMGILELSTGKIAAVNAGHECPAIFRADENEWASFRKFPHSLPLALYPGIPFTDEDIVLNKGDVLFVYTDGVTEASKGDNEMFGEDGLLTVLSGLKEASPEDMIRGTYSGIKDFIGDNAQFDDITMLCVKYYG